MVIARQQNNSILHNKKRNYQIQQLIAIHGAKYNACNIMHHQYLVSNAIIRGDIHQSPVKMQMIHEMGPQ